MLLRRHQRLGAAAFGDVARIYDHADHVRPGKAFPDCLEHPPGPVSVPHAPLDRRRRARRVEGARQRTLHPRMNRADAPI